MSEYAQKCNWCEWKDTTEIVDTCPSCDKTEYLMDVEEAS